MDLYQKQQAGVDTSQLQQRVLELKQQLSSLSRGRGRGRPITARGRYGRRPRETGRSEHSRLIGDWCNWYGNLTWCYGDGHSVIYVHLVI